MNTHQKLIVDKLSSVLDGVNPSYDTDLVAMLDEAKRVFITGAGRSGLVTRFFGMRLLHSGYQTFIVGEVATPSIQDGDLLIIISGSGETTQLVSFGNVAKKMGAKVMLISASGKSTIGDLADGVFQIGSEGDYNPKTPAMPMGSVFELSTLLFLEATVSFIMEKKGLNETGMRAIHANME